MDPVVALRQIAYYKDRVREDTRRVMAYRNAADIVERLDDAERERHGQALIVAMMMTAVMTPIAVLLWLSRPPRPDVSVGRMTRGDGYTSDPHPPAGGGG
jgi:hypothetical protein